MRGEQDQKTAHWGGCRRCHSNVLIGAVRRVSFVEPLRIF